MSKRRGVADKQRRLRELRQRMEDHFKLHFPDSRLWFFTDEGGGVDGYLGTEPVMFVGSRPSSGRGGLAPQVLGDFYGLMKEYGFSQAHVTDVVKEVGEGDPSPEEVKQNWPFFLEELRIVQPKVVVALGRWVFDTLEQRLDWLVPVRRFTHYAYRFRSHSKREEQSRADFERLKRMLESADTRDAQDDLIP